MSKTGPETNPRPGDIARIVPASNSGHLAFQYAPLNVRRPFYHMRGCMLVLNDHEHDVYIDADGKAVMIRRGAGDPNSDEFWQPREE